MTELITNIPLIFSLLAGGSFDTNLCVRPLSCSIVFGVAGWTAMMEVVTESNILEKRILTKHYF